MFKLYCTQLEQLETNQGSLQTKISELESKSGPESQPEAESTAMEASTPAEDAAPTPVVAAPEAAEPKATEPVPAEEKPAAGISF